MNLNLLISPSFQDLIYVLSLEWEPFVELPDSQGELGSLWNLFIYFFLIFFFLNLSHKFCPKIIRKSFKRFILFVNSSRNGP